ncbi:MAG: hypothetical protein P8H31_02615 [Porticoccaceae bacterium]|jgi:hypothetical protein|nr:hypothetical protein [Porticoccaceae bacterium]
MPLAEFELVMLESGEVALQRTGSDQPLVRINFAPEAMSYLDGKHIEVAKCMMDAGLQKAFDVGEEQALQSDDTEAKVHTLH